MLKPPRSKNTQRLLELMSEHNLTVNEVAELLNRKPHTVSEWRCANANNISDNNLALLELLLDKRGA